MISPSERGMFCEAGGFHIDPHKAVEVALITHAHSDHARRGCKKYYCAKSSVGLLRRRMGPKADIVGVPYGEPMRFGATVVSFHPAGHILGSAQIRVQLGDRVWVASGDYKRDDDPSCEPFEVVPCDTFITEATFGHPQYQWDDPAIAIREIHEWWEENRKRGRNSLLHAYALGKSQRVLAGLLKHTDRPVHVYGETADLAQCYRDEGVAMVPTIRLEDLSHEQELRGELIIAPQSITRTPWFDRLKDPQTAFASGWMRTGAFGYGRSFDRGFVLSDHADWNGLLRTVRETGARRVLVFHGGDTTFTRYLRKQGIEAHPLTEATARAAQAPLQADLFSTTFGLTPPASSVSDANP